MLFNANSRYGNSLSLAVTFIRENHVMARVALPIGHRVQLAGQLAIILPKLVHAFKTCQLFIQFFSACGEHEIPEKPRLDRLYLIIFIVNEKKSSETFHL